jgi:hypothetical protein
MPNCTRRQPTNPAGRALAGFVSLEKLNGSVVTTEPLSFSRLLQSQFKRLDGHVLVTRLARPVIFLAFARRAV